MLHRVVRPACVSPDKILPGECGPSWKLYDSYYCDALDIQRGHVLEVPSVFSRDAYQDTRRWRKEIVEH